MKKYTQTKSTVKPQNIVIDDYSVWVHTNIKPVEENLGKENEFRGFEYTLIQYSKDEYIKLKIEEQNTLSERINNTQLALCEIYENLEAVK